MFLSGEDFEGVGPGLTLAEREHGVEFFARSFVAVDGAAVKRALEGGGFAKGALKLKLVNAGEEIASVRDVCRNVILCARIKVGFGAADGRSNALILQAKIPPRFVEVRRFDLSGENFPAPLVDKQAER